MGKRDHHRRPALPDWHLWTEVASTIRPLPGKRQKLPRLADTPLPMPPAPSGKPRKLAALAATAPSFRPEARPGRQAERTLEPRLRQRLGRGQIEIDGTIDLHGMRQAEAHAALARFIRARAARGDRTILVITGKGLKRSEDDAASIVERGVLRTMLPIWLSQPGLAQLIAGWDVSARAHGGEGAYYVRLRRGGGTA
jgi:DNA-nicking Smr family endonuclease